MFGSRSNIDTDLAAKTAPRPVEVADHLLKRANAGDAATVKEGIRLAKFCKDDIDVQARVVLVCLATGHVGQAKQLGRRLKANNSPVAVWARAALAVASGDTKGGAIAVGELQGWFQTSGDARALAGGHAINVGDFLEAEKLFRTVQAEKVCPAYRYPIIYAAARKTGDIAGAGAQFSQGLAGSVGGAAGSAIVGRLHKVVADAKKANFGSATMTFISGPHAVYKA